MPCFVQASNGHKRLATIYPYQWTDKLLGDLSAPNNVLRVGVRGVFPRQNHSHCICARTSEWFCPGRCLGVTALHLPISVFHVILSKSVLGTDTFEDRVSVPLRHVQSYVALPPEPFVPPTNDSVNGRCPPTSSR